LASDIVGHTRLAGADEGRILARRRTPRSDLIDPTIAVHHGRIVKRTGERSIIAFRSVVDAVRCAIEVQNGLAERNAGVRTIKGSNSASACALATLSRRAMATSSAIASTSPRVCKPSLSPAPYAFPSGPLAGEAAAHG
jgi:class 3 adenylate cyclase